MDKEPDERRVEVVESVEGHHGSHHLHVVTLIILLGPHSHQSILSMVYIIPIKGVAVSHAIVN